MKDGRERRARAVQPRRRGRRILLIIAGVMLAIGAATATGVGIWLAPYAGERMDMGLLELPEVSEPAVLLAYTPGGRGERAGPLHPAAGGVIAPPERRIYVAYEEIPAHLINAFVAIEDKHFWEHGGVDLLRTARAGAAYLGGHASFGASTITQQLVKNLTGEDEITAERKLTEIFRAMDLERQADKTEILGCYLNIINLAEGCRGIGAAAERYFSKKPSELELIECAALAAITNNPARYDPLTHPEENRRRRDLILCEMAEDGYITAAERDAALATETELHPSEPAGGEPASWYADMVVADVIRDLVDRLGYSRTKAAMLVYGGGLTVECALDEELQALAEAYYRDITHFPVGERGRPQSSFLLIDPHTGDILAVAGAVGEKGGNRLQNYATDTRRPAGSCIKPLSVYAPALRQGLITWASLYEDAPVQERGGVGWPANADGIYRGPITVGEAVAESVNTVAVRILEELGRDTSLAFLRKEVGLSSLRPPEARSEQDGTVASLALGQQVHGVSVRELTGAYTVFSGGCYHPPVSYHRVLDREGRVLLENPPIREERRVLSAEEAAVMTELLCTVTERGTAARYMRISERLGIEAAGKTGTTQNTCDRWFIGYTPRLLGGVWMGYDYPGELRGILGNPCVGIWNDLLIACEEAYVGEPSKAAFDRPPGMVSCEICRGSGLLAGPYCREAEEYAPGTAMETGWFVRGTEPYRLCTRHTEPPIRILPEDPMDPDRIPHLPNDILPEMPQLPPDERRRKRWRSRWFSRTAR